MMWLYGPPPPHQPSIQLYPFRSQFGVSVLRALVVEALEGLLHRPGHRRLRGLIGLSVMLCIR